MSDSISIKVTKIGKLWHARLLENKRVIDESACTRKDDIGWICRNMLRWYSKLGGVSKFADAASMRQDTCNPKGTVYAQHELPV